MQAPKPADQPEATNENPTPPHASHRRLTIIGWALLGIGALGVAATLGSLSAEAGPNTLRLYLFVVSVAVGSTGAGVLRAAAVWKWNIAAHAEDSRRLDRIEHKLEEQDQASVRIEAVLDALGQLASGLAESVKQLQARTYLADVRQRLGDEAGSGKVLQMPEVVSRERA